MSARTGRGHSAVNHRLRCHRDRGRTSTPFNQLASCPGGFMKIPFVVRCSVLQLCIGTLVALPGLAQAGKAKPSQTVLDVPCSEIFARGIDMQENLRATAIRVGCGLEAPGEAGAEGEGESGLDLTNINPVHRG